MTAHPPEPVTEPFIPMPALTPEALRAAVANLTPSRVPAFEQDLVEAATNAQQAQSLAPLRTFVHTWGMFLAIQRRPFLAGRLRHLEEVISEGVENPVSAIAEIRKIHAEAEASLRATAGETAR